jgi:hypothetical protein
MARTLAILFYRMIKFGQDYVDRGTEFYEQRQRDQQLQYLKTKAARLGFRVLPITDTPYGVSGECSVTSAVRTHHRGSQISVNTPW